MDLYIKNKRNYIDISRSTNDDNIKWIDVSTYNVIWKCLNLDNRFKLSMTELTDRSLERVLCSNFNKLSIDNLFNYLVNYLFDDRGLLKLHRLLDINIIVLNNNGVHYVLNSDSNSGNVILLYRYHNLRSNRLNYYLIKVRADNRDNIV